MRAPLLYDGPIIGNYKVIEDKTYPNGSKISRADVAHFLVNALSENCWVNRTLAIADPL